jgi:hypothetical protein
VEALEGRDVPSTLTVTNNLGYATPGSLPYEISSAANGDKIVFNLGPNPQTISLSNPPGVFGGPRQLVIRTNVDIEGPGADTLAINGANVSRVFEVVPGVQATIAGLTIEYGNGKTGAYDPAADDGMGGSILNYGTLTVTGCRVSGDAVNANADYGGGIYNAGTLTVSGSTVTHNIARYEGGGIYNSGTATVLNSTVINNSAYAGADVFTDHLFTFSKKNSRIGQVTYY